MFRIRFFVRIYIELFSRVRIGQKSGCDPGKSGFAKKVQKLQQHVEQICISYLALSTLSSFFQVPPKPNQKHHLDPISLLMDGSGV